MPSNKKKGSNKGKKGSSKKVAKQPLKQAVAAVAAVPVQDVLSPMIQKAETARRNQSAPAVSEDQLTSMLQKAETARTKQSVSTVSGGDKLTTMIQKAEAERKKQPNQKAATSASKLSKEDQKTVQEISGKVAVIAVKVAALTQVVQQMKQCVQSKPPSNFCPCCERMCVVKEKGDWICWFCDPSNNTAWHCRCVG